MFSIRLLWRGDVARFATVLVAEETGCLFGYIKLSALLFLLFLVYPINPRTSVFSLGKLDNSAINIVPSNGSLIKSATMRNLGATDEYFEALYNKS